MSSAPILDAAPAPVAPAPTIPSLPNNESSDEPFGAILEEATDGVSGQTTDPQEPAPSKEKKKDEDPTSVVPLYYFSPPPTIDVPAATVPKPTTIQNVATIETPAPSASTSTPTQSTVSSPSLTQTVAPKAVESQPRKSSEGIELNPKLFQTVLPEAALPNSEISKAPEPQRPPVANASHGTLVAQLENRVKNSEKTAENAPAIEQKMPVRDDLRRAVAEASRIEPLHIEKQPAHVLSADFASEAHETIPVKSLQAAHLVETIRTEVATLRQRNDTTMTVVLRPDSGTQLSLDLSIARDGSVHAQARCERGDFHTLQAQWPQLQQSLAAHGIRIADLSNQNGAQQQGHRSPEAFQNSTGGQNQNQQQQRADRESPSFEEQFNASKTKSPLTKPQPQPPASTSTTRRWQSWA